MPFHSWVFFDESLAMVKDMARSRMATCWDEGSTRLAELAMDARCFNRP